MENERKRRVIFSNASLADQDVSLEWVPLWQYTWKMGMAEVITALDGQSVPWESCQLAQMVQKRFIASHIRNVLPLLQQV